MARRRRRPARPGALADLAPRRILTQILVLQVLYYAVAGALILFTTLVAGQNISADLLFSWEPVRGDITSGWTLALCWMFSSLISVIFLLLLIARSKLVADFACTIHLLHLVVVSVYTRGLPRNVFWWELQIVSAALMTALGMWACQWRELKPIAFGGRGKTAGEGAAGPGTGTSGQAEEGRGLLAREDGGTGGLYEMVGLKRDGG